MTKTNARRDYAPNGYLFVSGEETLNHEIAEISRRGAEDAELEMTFSALSAPLREDSFLVAALPRYCLSLSEVRAVRGCF